MVKGEKFKSWRTVGHVQQAVKIHQARGVDELIVLDIAATPANRGPDFEFIETLTDECFMPLTVGGGVRSVADVKRLLRCGADKVSIGTAAHGDGFGGFILDNCAAVFGRQAIVASVDVWGSQVFMGCGKEATAITGVAWAVACESRGAGEILLTSIDREGTMRGYDIELIRSVSRAVDIPVIAHGGCGSYEHMLEAIRAGASAVAAGAFFQFTDATPKGAASYLSKHGVEVRL